MLLLVLFIKDGPSQGEKLKESRKKTIIATFKLNGVFIMVVEYTVSWDCLSLFSTHFESLIFFFQCESKFLYCYIPDSITVERYVPSVSKIA